MASQRPYLHPNLPFTGCIQGSLFEGKTVTVSGRVLAGAERFFVNLQCVTNTSSDIALHFNPRYVGNSGHVVCNTLQNSCWGSEQKTKNTPLPRGSDFTLTFLVNRDSYSVIVNGTHFLEYLHRLPVSRVNAISVDGGVEIVSIAFQNPSLTINEKHPEVQRVQSKVTRGSGWNMQRHQQHESPIQAAATWSLAAPPPYSAPAYVLPYKTIIQEGFSPCRGITVQGCVNHNANKFSINLRYNSGIALHFNPRFNENVVVRNSLLKECWGKEEKNGGMPFYRGQQFTVSITCDTQCYRIAVNGTQMFTYNHRYFLFHQIDILEVEGNISNLPFTGCIQGGLFEGKTITVTGRVLAGAERFFVNLQCGTKTSSDIALHFNPRYVGNSGHVVCNTLQNSCWGSEQRTNHTPLPKSFDFILTFLVNRDSYSLCIYQLFICLLALSQVIVNGGHFLEYLHRLPVSRVNAISVDGGVEIVSIAFQNPAASWVAQPCFAHKVKFSYAAPGLCATPPPYSPPQAYVLPYKTILQAGLYPGRVITMQGFVNHNADKCVHLQYKSVQATEYQILKPSPSVTALQNQPLVQAPQYQPLKTSLSVPANEYQILSKSPSVPVPQKQILRTSPPVQPLKTNLSVPAPQYQIFKTSPSVPDPQLQAPQYQPSSTSPLNPAPQYQILRTSPSVPSPPLQSLKYQPHSTRPPVPDPQLQASQLQPLKASTSVSAPQKQPLNTSPPAPQYQPLKTSPSVTATINQANSHPQSRNTNCAIIRLPFRAFRFSINLRYNYGIALHFNPRFNENVVVRNSLLNECWGKEERNGGMPFYRGQQFTVSITCDTQCYRIAVNGTQMFVYNHRHFLLQEIDILEVEGNLSVSSVTV
ncbi:hypothetical protein QTP70_015568 [Hemibagrus guttatus]|uniref:Galectin domain-containing protein n=1 Tax=Hemibagrus guttatus TaxID=175788 RepID=A0AAE0QIR6_9TELE|nr:hypothetical protein QTP70_015568 [Hemibagrus guttatus]